MTASAPVQVTVPTPPPPTRRFAPVLQFLTSVDVATKEELCGIGEAGHRAGYPLERICYELHTRAVARGYFATIGMQEVASAAMPSFPGQQVITPVLLLDLQPFHPASRLPR